MGNEISDYCLTCLPNVRPSGVMSILRLGIFYLKLPVFTQNANYHGRQGRYLSAIYHLFIYEPPHLAFIISWRTRYPLSRCTASPNSGLQSSARNPDISPPDAHCTLTFKALQDRVRPRTGKILDKLYKHRSYEIKWTLIFQLIHVSPCHYPQKQFLVSKICFRDAEIQYSFVQIWFSCTYIW